MVEALEKKHISECFVVISLGYMYIQCQSYTGMYKIAYLRNFVSDNSYKFMKLLKHYKVITSK